MYRNGRNKAGKLVVTNLEGIEVTLLDAAKLYSNDKRQNVLSIN